MIKLLDQYNKDHWYFLIETNQYTGNFGGQLVSFVTGILDYVGDYQKFVDDYVSWKGTDDADYNKYVEVNSEYGPQIYSLAGNNKECNSVAIMLKQEPTKEHLNELGTRTNLFPDAWEKIEDRDLGEIKVLRTSLVKVEVKTTEIAAW